MRRSKTIGLVVLVMAGLAFGACEDDPILDPTEDEDSDNGSYGMLYFDRSAGEARDAGPPDTLRRQNPKVF